MSVNYSYVWFKLWFAIDVICITFKICCHATNPFPYLFFKNMMLNSIFKKLTKWLWIVIKELVCFLSELQVDTECYYPDTSHSHDLQLHLRPNIIDAARFTHDCPVPATVCVSHLYRLINASVISGSFFEWK